MAAVCLTALAISDAQARPRYFVEFKAAYPKVVPLADQAKCNVCHIGKPVQRTWNEYGTALGRVLDGRVNVTDPEAIREALIRTEQEKRSDGVPFGALLEAGQLPVDPPVAPDPGDPPDPPGPQAPVRGISLGL